MVAIVAFAAYGVQRFGFGVCPVKFSRFKGRLCLVDGKSISCTSTIVNHQPHNVTSHILCNSTNTMEDI